MSRRPPRLHTLPDRQWRQLLQEGGAGGTKTYVMEVPGGSLVQVVCSDGGQPIAVDVVYVPDAKVADFGTPE